MSKVDEVYQWVYHIGYDEFVTMDKQVQFKNKLRKVVEDEVRNSIQDKLKVIIKATYTLVTFPECQKYMEEPWFEKEAFLEVEGRTGNSSYFIPTKYI